MYEVLIGAETLFYPNDEKSVIYNAKLKLPVGNCGQFSFNCPVTNPLYTKIAQGAVVRVLRDGKEFWRGEVTEIERDFYKTLEVVCIEDLGWLAAEYLWVIHRTDNSYRQMFEMWLEEYNARQGTNTERKFQIGYITNVSPTGECNWSTSYETSVLDALRENICKDNGFLRVRRVTNGNTVTRYIDCVRLEDYGKQATQAIEFGSNLLDYVQKMDMNNFTNVLYPFGAELEKEIYEGQRERLAGAQIYNAESVQNYGRHAKTVIFETEDIETLNRLAQAYLTRYSQPQITLKVSAIDLADLGDAERIELGDSVRVIADRYAIDQWMYVREIEIDIINIADNKLTMSSHANTYNRSLITQMISQDQLLKDMPTKNSIIDAARKNALRLLEGTAGGYVTFGTNEDEQIVEIRITNNLDIEQATKMWKWNAGGLGYLERPSPQHDWKEPEVAMTMDGSIVADSITSGLLSLSGEGAVLKAFTNIPNSPIMVTGGDTYYADDGYQYDVPANLNSRSNYPEISSTFITDPMSFSATGYLYIEPEHKLIESIQLSNGINAFNTALDPRILNEGQFYRIVCHNSGQSDFYGYFRVVKTVDTNTTIDQDGIWTKKLTAIGGEIAGYDISANGFTKVESDRMCEYSRNMMRIGGRWNSQYWTYVGIANLGEFLHLDYGGSTTGGIWVTNNGKNDLYDFSGGTMRIRKSSVSCSAYGEVTWSGSDERIKHDIEDLQLHEAIKLIESARARKFEMNEEKGKRYGFIAQELRQVLDDDSAIEFGTEEMRNIHYLDFIPALVEYVKDLKTQIIDLKNEVKEMKGEKTDG